MNDKYMENRKNAEVPTLRLRLWLEMFGVTLFIIPCLGFGHKGTVYASHLIDHPVQSLWMERFQCLKHLETTNQGSKFW
jgi:hypothetical protein